MKTNFPHCFKAVRASARALFVLPLLLVVPGGAMAANYQDMVIRLAPTYYYELNETDTAGGAVDTMGNAAAPGVYNGTYGAGGPEVGIPGPLVVFNPDDPAGTPVPGVGGEDNLAHLSNNGGHITLGPGAAYGANAITVALFIKAGNGAQGGDRVFTNNLTDPTKSFQMNIGNNGPVLAVDPNQAGANAERTLYQENGGGHDTRFLQEASGWFHVVASTEGATGAERASNFRMWVNGVNRTVDLMPDSTGWGTDTGMAKIGGRRANATDTTTHSGGQDEVAIWLDRVLTDTEIEDLWQAAITEKFIPLEFTDITTTEEPDETISVDVTWRSRPGRRYAICVSTDLQEGNWIELDDSIEAEVDSETTSFTETGIEPGTPRRYYRVSEAEG